MTFAAPLRIALITYSTKPRGGVVHTLSLAEALVRQGHRVDVWSLARGGDTGFFRPVLAGVRVRLVPLPDVAGEAVGARILRSIAILGAAFATDAVGDDAAGDDAAGYDVVHAQDCISANAVGDCVRTIHHLDVFTTPELAACHERAIVAPMAHICVSHAVAREVHDGWGITATVIPNGVDQARFASAASDSRPAVTARADWTARLGRYVLAVGGIEPRKGTLDLIRAMAAVQRCDQDLKLVIAGGETIFDYRDYRARVDSESAELGVRSVLLGPVDHDALPALVAAAAVFAFPSTKEGFGLAAMEALAAGVPVVTRDLPVLREVFGDAVRYAGDAAGLAAQILDAARNPDPARASVGRALAGRHNWDDSARAHAAFYRRLAQPRPAQPSPAPPRPDFGGSCSLSEHG